MTDPIESLARALTDVMFGQSWAGLTQDARTIALAETRVALTRAAKDITAAIAEWVDDEIGYSCQDSNTLHEAIDAIRGWRP